MHALGTEAPRNFSSEISTLPLRIHFLHVLCSLYIPLAYNLEIKHVLMNTNELI